MAKMLAYVKFLMVFSVVVSGVGCGDPVILPLEGPYVPPAIKGDDGRRLIWEPEVGGKECYEPVFSPDGKKIAVSYRYGKFAPDADLAVYDIYTKELTILVANNRVRRPAWSPTGEWIAYQSDYGRVIWLVRPDGTDHHALEIEGGFRCFSPKWARDGSKLFLLVDSEDHRRLDAGYYDLEENALIRFSTSPNMIHRAAIPGPSGESAVISLFNENFDNSIIIGLADINGPHLQVLWRGSNGEDGWPLDWSPKTGDYLLITYTQRYFGQQALWVYNVKKGEITQLTTCPSEVGYESLIYGSWGPNGYIVFGTEEGKLYLIKAPE
jgi:Tol biopolymer transport system component